MTQHRLGKFCSMAKKGTIIIPKPIAGYITPEGQVLTEANQHFNFVYIPIKYNISYELNGGVLSDKYKTQYTIRDKDYIPPTPILENHTFTGWNPSKISKGSIGDVTFSANWKPNAILISGSELNEALSGLVESKDQVIAIYNTQNIPTGVSCIDISSTSTSILAYFNNDTIYIYSEEPIYCNLDMSNAFADFTMLRDISALSTWICKNGTDISRMFENCRLLANLSPISQWANAGNFSNFTDAFKGTIALSSGRVPLWYRWNVKIKYTSSSGKLLNEIIEDKIPEETIYPTTINGYLPITNEIQIDSPDKEYSFVYEPIKYPINYSLNGAEIYNPKTEYTIEDETYYPPVPSKQGFEFSHWIPECINSGEYGQTSFVAVFNVKGE